MQKQILGVIGGFGAYATQDFLNKLYKQLYVSSERDYPHIVCDNNFSMPSRTRALLYGDDYQVIVNEIADSFKKLIDVYNADKIVLVCGTAHYFLPDVYEIVPEAQNRVINMIECLRDNLEKKETKKVLVIAAEGALKKHLYSSYLNKAEIECIEPGEMHFDTIRKYIEVVKQNKFNDILAVANDFYDFIKMFESNHVVLGCTEFPVLIDKINGYDMDFFEKRDMFFEDPVDCVINKLAEIFSS